MNNSPERRRDVRIKTNVKVCYHVAFDIDAKVKYQVISNEEKLGNKKKYNAVTKNVSAEGVCFICDRQLEKGSVLSIELKEPNKKLSVSLQGKIRWCHEFIADSNKKNEFHVGVKVNLVNDASVYDSIVEYEDAKMRWSILLETIYGKYEDFNKDFKGDNDS